MNKWQRTNTRVSAFVAELFPRAASVIDHPALVLSAVVASLASNARAEELYLRCELRNWCCNPITYQIDFENSTITIDGDARHRARISQYEIVWEYPDGHHRINRMTGDLEFTRGNFLRRGTCVKMDKKF
jgi:hypothetical protein